MSQSSQTNSLNAAADEVRIFRNAINRFESFRLHKWPREDINLRDLAEAGFFLPKVRSLPDEVECIFCRVRIGNWSPEVDAFLEHLRHSPRCDFLSGYNVGNIPMGRRPFTDPVRGVNKRLPNLDVCGRSPHHVNRQAEIASSSPSSVSTPSFQSPLAFTNNPMSSQPINSVSIQQGEAEGRWRSPQPGELIHRPPKFITLVTTQARLKSFPQNWPQLCPISAESLADAGFFYSGSYRTQSESGSRMVTLDDVVSCFHCGRMLFNWRPEDNAWEEHRRFSSDCYFLALNYPNAARISGTNVLAEQEVENNAPVDQNTTATKNSCPHAREEANKSDEGNKESQSSTSDPLGEVSSLRNELTRIASQERPKNIHESNDESKGTCKVCFINEVGVLFFPCKHASCCGQCAASVKECPLCRSPITGSVGFYLG